MALLNDKLAEIQKQLTEGKNKLNYKQAKFPK